MFTHHMPTCYCRSSECVIRDVLSLDLDEHLNYIIANLTGNQNHSNDIYYIVDIIVIFAMTKNT